MTSESTRAGAQASTNAEAGDLAGKRVRFTRDVCATLLPASILAAAGELGTVKKSERRWPLPHIVLTDRGQVVPVNSEEVEVIQ